MIAPSISMAIEGISKVFKTYDTYAAAQIDVLGKIAVGPPRPAFWYPHSISVEEPL